MTPKQDLVGMRFGRLTVLEEIPERRNEKIVYKCICDCGNVKDIVGASLKCGLTQSCGCFHLEQASIYNSKVNEYDLSGDIGIVFASNTNNPFLFDLEDYPIVRNYCWMESRKDGYLYSHYTKHPSKKIVFHRTVMGMPVYANAGELVDHIDRNKYDNRKKNLRIVNNSQNSINSTIRADNKTGIIGVEKTKSGKFSVKITHNKIVDKLGTFSSFEDAVYTRLLAEKKYFGEFAPQKHLYSEYGISE